MINKVYIKEDKIYAFHGVLPDERIIGAYYTVNVSVETDFSNAVLNDALNGTVNYATMHDIIKREMGIPSGLVEHVAGRIVTSLFREITSVQSVNLSIIKQNPPMDADCKGAGVEIQTSRQEWEKLMS